MRRAGTVRGLGVAALALAAVALTGCGGDYSDLVGVRRSGSLPDARLELVVNGGGTARCNGGEPQQIAPRLLLDARDIVRELTPELEAGRVYARPPNALLRYDVETAQGELSFSDTDGTRDPGIARMVAFVRRAAQDVCGLDR